MRTVLPAVIALVASVAQAKKEAEEKGPREK